MLSLLEGNELVLREMQRLNNKFICEAEKAWDKYGEGYFAEFVKRYITIKWFELVRSN